MRAAGVLARTLVVAPDFKTGADGPLAGELYWTSDGWKHGNLSAEPDPHVRISSFAAVDTLLRVLADRSRFPRLENIVVTGHSAGGQFTHRYAGASPVAERQRGLPVRFVAANPSAHLWPGRSGHARAAQPTFGIVVTDRYRWMERDTAAFDLRLRARGRYVRTRAMRCTLPRSTAVTVDSCACRVTARLPGR